MGICELKSQMYESPHGKMLTSTKITVNSLESSQNCRSSEKLLWSFTCQYSGKRFSLLLNIPPGCETLVKENNDSYVLVSQTNMAGSSWPPWPLRAKAIQRNSVFFNLIGQLSYAWALFLGYYLGCPSSLKKKKQKKNQQNFSTSFSSSSWKTGEIMFLILRYFRSQIQTLLNIKLLFNPLGRGFIRIFMVQKKLQYCAWNTENQLLTSYYCYIINNNSSAQVTVTSDRSRKQVIFSSCDYSTLQDIFFLLINVLVLWVSLSIHLISTICQKQPINKYWVTFCWVF